MPKVPNLLPRFEYYLLILELLCITLQIISKLCKDRSYRRLQTRPRRGRARKQLYLGERFVGSAVFALVIKGTGGLNRFERPERPREFDYRQRWKLAGSVQTSRRADKTRTSRGTNLLR
jgi:hypothetical protein